MVIQHNISSLNSWRNTKINNNNVSKSLEKLSSGFRINRAGDDAAGLAISEKMRGQIRGTMMGTQNANMGINLVQTAEGGLNETHAILQRMRELAVQASNGTYQDIDRAQIDKEYQALKSEVDRIAESTHYNGIDLLNVSSTTQVPITQTVIDTWMEPVYRTETTPIDDVILNQIQASVTDPPVRSDGMFQFFASNNNGLQEKLLFNGRGVSTSWPSIRVNDQRHNIWDLPVSQQTVHIGNNTWSTTFSLNSGNLDLTVTQNVSIVDNPANIGGQSYKIDYIVTNNNPEAPVEFDLMYHVDTMLGENDRAPFKVNDQIISNNTRYEGANIPGQVSIFDDASNPFIYGVISVNSSSGFNFSPGSEPDTLNLAHYSTADDAYDGLPNGSVGDSGYSVVWSDRTAGNNSVTMTTYYGVQNPPADVLAGLGESVETQVLDHYEPRTAAREVIIGYREEGHDPELWIQSGANVGDGMHIKLCDARSPALGIDQTAVDPQEKANEAIAFIDNAANTVSSYRADFGASQNRLESTVNNNGVKTENLQAAESSIRDVDMAKEMMNFTKNNILVQAAQSMLAQANQLPQGVLALLR